MNDQQRGNPYEQLILKAWIEDGFRTRLMANPKAVMKEMGWDLAKVLEIEVVESTQRKAYLVIAPKPVGKFSERELTEQANMCTQLIAKAWTNGDLEIPWRPPGYYREEHGKQYGQLIAKAWTDEGFRAQLMVDPKAAMKKVGIDVLEGVEIEVIESTQKKACLVIPPKAVAWDHSFCEEDFLRQNWEGWQALLSLPIFLCWDPGTPGVIGGKG